MKEQKLHDLTHMEAKIVGPIEIKRGIVVR
jgi:hypothetical protein